jgi:hypothetical protein
MSSGRLKEHRRYRLDHLTENGPYFHSLLSEIVKPFHPDHEVDYIYDGTEDIPFKERDPLYQSILIEEFITLG